MSTLQLLAYLLFVLVCPLMMVHMLHGGREREAISREPDEPAGTAPAAHRAGPVA